MDIGIDRHTIIPFTILLVTILINALFGLIVLIRTYRKPYGWFFAGTVLGVAAWALGDMLMLFGKTQPLVQVGAQLFYIGPMIIPISIWFFAINFPEGRKVTLPLALGSSGAIIVYALTFLYNFDFFIHDIQITQHGLNIASPQSPGFVLYAAFFSFSFLLVYAAFLLKMRKLKGLSKVQVTYTFLGAFGASVPALITNLSLPLMGKKDIIWLGPLFTLLFAASVVSAIVRHKLFDIRFYTVRALAYLLTLLVVAVAYVIPAVLLTTYLLRTSLQLTTLLLLACITLVVAFLFQPLMKLFRRWSNNLFYQDVYDPQTFIDQLNKVLVARIELNPLLQDASIIISNNLKAEYCLFGINETEFRGQRVIGTIKKEFAATDVKVIQHVTQEFTNSIIVTDNLEQQYEKLHKVLSKNNIAVLAQLAPEGAVHKVGLGYLLLGPKRSGNPYNNQDLRVIGIIAKELFITIQNALHFEEIENFNITLQQKVEDATRKLRRTNEKLRRLDEIKDDFISMASHQLRTPLTSVKGYVSMVLDGDAGRLTPLQRKLLNQSFVSSQRMAYLISDLLNVSRLRTGKFVIDSIPTNLAKVVQDEVNQLQETVKGRNLRLTYNHPEHFPTLMLDETKIRQVIMNFIDNAIYYTPSGGRIAVNLIETPKTIELTVVDTGIGVPKPEQHHLFSKFFRAHNAKHARPDGTGLGLFMAKKVIIAQGGAVIFKSQKGKGSTFGFTFPKAALGAPSKSAVSTRAP